MKTILFMFGKFCGFLFPVILLKNKIHIAFQIYKTGFISNSFKAFGTNVFISKNVIVFGGKSISIGNNVSLGANSTLSSWDNYGGLKYEPEIVIGDDVTIGEGFHITAINKIIIKKGVLTCKYLTISDNSHGRVVKEESSIMPSKRILISKGPVIIEENVWIGDKVKILSNIKIGKNAIIGANSVVTKDVLPNTVMGGNPAKMIKDLHESKEQAK